MQIYSHFVSETTPPLYRRKLDRAEQFAAAAFKRFYVHPDDREFIDRPPGRLAHSGGGNAA